MKFIVTLYQTSNLSVIRFGEPSYSENIFEVQDPYPKEIDYSMFGVKRKVIFDGVSIVDAIFTELQFIHEYQTVPKLLITALIFDCLPYGLMQGQKSESGLYSFKPFTMETSHD